jgi:hypothetical protein
LAENLLPPRPINPRDLKIYRLHTAEKKKIPELSSRFNLSEERVWEILHCDQEKRAIAYRVMIVDDGVPKIFSTSFLVIFSSVRYIYR